MKRTYRDQIECLEAIGGYVVSHVPGDWERIEVKAKIFDGGLVMTESTFKSVEAGKPKAFTIDDAETSVEFNDCFLQLSDLVGDRESGPFKACLYVLNRDGHYRVDYEY